MEQNKAKAMSKMYLSVLLYYIRGKVCSLCQCLIWLPSTSYSPSKYQCIIQHLNLMTAFHSFSQQVFKMFFFFFNITTKPWQLYVGTQVQPYQNCSDMANQAQCWVQTERMPKIHPYINPNQGKCNSQGTSVTRRHVVK